MAKLRVGVLFGGRSVEHAISLLSARSVMRALDPSKYEVVPIGITDTGKWLPPGEAAGLLESGSPSQEQEGALQTAASDLTSLIVSERPLSQLPPVDVIFPVLHGTFGEDGTVQGLLELADLPYVGGGVLSSALGMDKAMMKRVFRDAGLPVVEMVTVTRRDWGARPQTVTEEVAGMLGYPCFVKPSNGGSSIGISKVHTPEELEPALQAALLLDRKVLVEEAILGRELECSVLGNDDPVASAVGEVVPAREFYDYEAKYRDERTQLIVPAPIAPELSAQVRELACSAFRAVDGSGMARVDFFLRSSDNKLYVNEINTIPGFTQVSMYPKMWEATGLSYPELLDRLIELALERHAEKKQTWYNYANFQQQGREGL